MSTSENKPDQDLATQFMSFFIAKEHSEEPIYVRLSSDEKKCAQSILSATDNDCACG